jgi:hypothetical protein
MTDLAQLSEEWADVLQAFIRLRKASLLVKLCSQLVLNQIGQACMADSHLRRVFHRPCANEDLFTFGDHVFRG